MPTLKVNLPKDIISGYLEVGRIGSEVVMNLTNQQFDEKGHGHIIFSARQARNLARLLLKHAKDAEADWTAKHETANIPRSRRIGRRIDACT